MDKSDNKIHSDSKHAKAHGKDYVEVNDLRLEKPHKDWYLRQELGKQRNKPHYAPPKGKKTKQEWKKK